MKVFDKTSSEGWISACMVVPALLISGATMAFLYLVVPIFFAFCVALYVLKFSFEIWAWRRLPAENRQNHRAPFGLMNYNYVLSVRLEWVVFLIGFFGLIGWIEYARMIRL